MRDLADSSAVNALAPQPFIAVIPARLASSRLPGKALLEIGGQPMVVHVAKRARAAGAQQVIIATDTQAIIEVAHQYGFQAVLTRQTHLSGTDRLAEVVEHFGWSDETIVVNTQGDEPLLEPALIQSVVAHLASQKECAIATAAHPITDPSEIFDPNVVKTVLDIGGRALYFFTCTDSMGARCVPGPLAQSANDAKPALRRLSAHRIICIPRRFFAPLPTFSRGAA